MTTNKENKNIINKEENKNIIKELIPYIIIVIIVVLIRTFIMTPVKVNGSSMVSTLHDGDTMILNKIGMRFNDLKRFQIVVINAGDSYIIKRIIGLPNETIEYKDETLYINGKVLKDPYNKKNTGDIESIKLGENEYFVMGDNRGVSQDSRIIGPIDKKEILGTTKFILFPFKDFGNVK